ELVIQESYRIAKESKQPTTILLSPGATSFAMFTNEFERGSIFNKIVGGLQ
ncbi:UDP-N-acetylmuramoyl-L-alanine--D-glutamate ligase, partial [Candidatus Roizmanbacteria bacterium CG01_land_8_20_14_3_00_33_9]